MYVKLQNDSYLNQQWSNCPVVTFNASFKYNFHANILRMSYYEILRTFPDSWKEPKQSSLFPEGHCNLLQTDLRSFLILDVELLDSAFAGLDSLLGPVQVKDFQP